MKITALMPLLIASVVGLSGIVNATPFTAHDTQSQGFGTLIPEAGLNASDVARGIGLENLYHEGGFSSFDVDVSAGGGVSMGLTHGGDDGLSTPLSSTPLATVPEGGSTLLLLGAGVLALGLLGSGHNSRANCGGPPVR
jgi:hypothetical protein